MKLSISTAATTIIISITARCALASPTFSRSGGSASAPTPSDTPADLISAPRGILNPADQSMFFLHEFPMHDKLITHLHYYNYEEKHSRTGELYWAFLYKSVFDQPHTFGRTLVRGPRLAYHVRCAFLGRPEKDGNGGDETVAGRVYGKNERVDEDGLVEKMYFSWNDVVVADEPYSGIVCRMYFDLDDLKFGPDASWP